jgi:hypothetical protein
MVTCALKGTLFFSQQVVETDKRNGEVLELESLLKVKMVIFK